MEKATQNYVNFQAQRVFLKMSYFTYLSFLQTCPKLFSKGSHLSTVT